MSLSPGTRLGPYEVVALIGAGGMGEVYRAHDHDLGRDAAIKILPPLFADDPDRLARFRREAQVLASLNHPNIAGIYGLVDGAGIRGLALELVEGPTLAEMITARPSGLPLDDVLAIGGQIMEALEAAHETGIVHRDLKPANIKVTPAGAVKVLDFGLAKAIAEETASGDPSLSPTLTAGPTRLGVILGTAAYMSPEQARGKPVDKRTDIWAFACVVYEMLTGKRAFAGEDVTDTIAIVVRGEPDWTALPADVPPHIRTLVQRCLVKDRRARIPDITVARFFMNEGLAPPALATARDAAATPPPPPPRRRRVLVDRGLGLAAGIILTALGVWTALILMPARPLRPARFAIVPPPAQPLAIQGNDRDIAITRDGTHIVYRGGTGNGQLMIRPIDQLEARPIAGINAVRVPFLSPDGGWIGFFAADGLKKVSISGGPPITLCRFTGAPRGASWGPNDTIVFATADTSTGLISVPAGGGEPKVLTRPDGGKGELDHLFPSVLPGGRAVLFTIASSQIENAQIAILDLTTGERKTLVRGGSQAEYVEPGHLVYAAAGTLRAVRFNLANLQVESDPVPVVEQVMTLNTGAANFATARNGTLIYAPGGAGISAGTPRSLVWVSREGREDPIRAPPRGYVYPRVSPDGTRLAIDIRDQENDVWIWDLMRQTLTRLTFDPGLEQFAVWTPDSRRIVFASARAGAANLYWQAADGTGTVERLTTSTNQQFPTSMSLDRTRLVYYENAPKTSVDIGMLLLDGPAAAPVAGAPVGAAGPRSTQALIQTTFAEMNAEISPDGRWLAYQSNESGQDQVYVRPFPNVDAGRWQVSTAGGTRPVWARSGRELFYIDGNTQVTAVPVQTTGTTFSAGNPGKVFEARYFTGFNGRTYDVSPDGRRFLMIKDTASTEPTSPATPASMVVVLNWLEELKTRVGGK